MCTIYFPVYIILLRRIYNLHYFTYIKRESKIVEYLIVLYNDSKPLLVLVKNRYFPVVLKLIGSFSIFTRQVNSNVFSQIIKINIENVGNDVLQFFSLSN